MQHLYVYHSVYIANHRDNTLFHEQIRAKFTLSIITDAVNCWILNVRVSLDWAPWHYSILGLRERVSYRISCCYWKRWHHGSLIRHCKTWTSDTPLGCCSRLGVCSIILELSTLGHGGLDCRTFDGLISPSWGLEASLKRPWRSLGGALKRRWIIIEGGLKGTWSVLEPTLKGPSSVPIRGFSNGYQMLRKRNWCSLLRSPLMIAHWSSLSPQSPLVRVV